MIKRNPKDYTSIFATEYHIPITKISQIGREYDAYNRMSLLYKGKAVGQGELCISSKKSLHLHTEGVRLGKNYLNKGHGIYIYHHLINWAIKIGAKRIYSSTCLNDLSRRMWREKLPKFYKVKSQLTRKPCGQCGCKELRPERYYIDLE